MPRPPLHQIKAFGKLIRYWRSHPLASRNLGGTIGRFMRWQIASRLLGAPVVWPWINGTKLVVETGMTGATMNIYCGLHEFADMAFVLHMLRPEDRFLDVGANVGSYTILAAGVVGAEVMCVEPVPTTHKKLLTNLAVNDLLAKVQAVQCGVGAKDGEFIDFIADRDTMNQVAPAGYAGKTIQVPIRTLDSLLSEFSAVLWKVDVEGFEEAVLAGAADALANPRLLAIEMEGDSPNINRIMSAAGFSKYVYDAFSRELKPLSGSQSVSHNWLWIRNLEEVQKRCKEAPLFDVLNVKF